VIEPGAITAQLAKAWDSGQLLNEWMTGAERWPFAIACRAPSAGVLLERYAEVQAWIERLETASHQARLYRIEYEERRLQKLGLQRLPLRIWIDTCDQALHLIGKRPEFEQFTVIVMQTDARQPQLREWLLRRPLLALSYAADWPRLLDLCDWFQAHPRPNVYARQIDLPGIDTKFIEARLGILSELLDVVLPRDAIEATQTSSSRQRFAQRYGLKYEEPTIRLRLLDDKLIDHYRGISDITLPLSEFQRLNPPCEKVFITENKTSGLAFPAAANAMVIFGLGYGIDALQNASWLSGKDIIYWGDIDTHGYHILSRLREHWPHTQSLLMDEADLQRWLGLATNEPEASCNPRLPEHLQSAEVAAFVALREGRYGVRLRIEQERLPYSALQQMVFKYV
jgi:hypothetical protein